MLTNLRPSRKKMESAELVADLDEVLGKEVKFRLLGKEYLIKKLTTETFLKVMNGFSQLEKKARQDTITTDEALETYAHLFSTCIDGIDKKTVRDMSLPQVSALAQLIIDYATGRLGILEEAKKKT